MSQLTVGGIRLTNNSNSDPNVLDWYEEGTWTPILTSSAPGTLAVTYSIQTGNYTRIGRLVTLNFCIQIATITLGTATGGLRINGIPFAPLTGSHSYGVAYPIGMEVGSGSGLLSAIAGSAGPCIYLVMPSNNGSTYNPLISGVSASDSLLVTITYTAG